VEEEIKLNNESKNYHLLEENEYLKKNLEEDKRQIIAL